jgi:hypothetical protein
MREVPLVTTTSPENTLMECVRMLRYRARLRANRLFPENCFLELAKGFEPLTL